MWSSGQESLAVQTESRALALNVTERIQNMILQDKLSPGHKLPGERQLAEIFEVSRVTIREAIQILEQRGLVERVDRSGAFVCQISENHVGDSIERFFDFRQCSHYELIRVRELIEPEIAANAARNATDDDLKELDRYVRQIEEGYESHDSKLPVEPDILFHLKLASISGNQLLNAIAHGLYTLLKKYMLAQNVFMNTEKGSEGAHGHRIIYRAIAAHDAARARRAVRDHLKIARYAYLRSKSADSRTVKLSIRDVSDSSNE